MNDKKTDNNTNEQQDETEKIAEEKNDYDNSKINKQRAMWYCLLL